MEFFFVFKIDRVPHNHIALILFESIIIISCLKFINLNKWE